MYTRKKLDLEKDTQKFDLKIYKKEDKE